jgi:predicted metalloprotease with PDZ domain
VNEHNGIHIKSVLRGGAAEQAGFAAGDEWLGLEVGQPKARQAWRLNKLDDLALYLGGSHTFHAIVARDQRLMTLQVTLPMAVSQVKLRAHDEAKVTAWLAGKTTQKQ